MINWPNIYKGSTILKMSWWALRVSSQRPHPLQHALQSYWNVWAAVVMVAGWLSATLHNPLLGECAGPWALGVVQLWGRSLPNSVSPFSVIFWKTKILSTGWFGSGDWVPACKPKSHRFDSQSGPCACVAGQVASGGVREATDLFHINVSLPLFHPPLNRNKY